MDQTAFNQSQEVLQPPPSQVPVPSVEQSEETEPVKKSNKTKLLIVLGALAGVMLIFMLLVMFLPKRQAAGPAATPTPSPAPPQSQFSQQLDNLEKQINLSDPLRIDLEPPPLDYNIKF